MSEETNYLKMSSADINNWIDDLLDCCLTNSEESFAENIYSSMSYQKKTILATFLLSSFDEMDQQLEFICESKRDLQKNFINAILKNKMNGDGLTPYFNYINISISISDMLISYYERMMIDLISNRIFLRGYDPEGEKFNDEGDDYE